LAKIKEWKENPLSQHFQTIQFYKKKNKCEVGRTLKATLLTPSNKTPLGYGWIYHLFLRPLENRKQYEVTISDYSAYNCMDFSSFIIALCPLASRGRG
jgi:hypothetical protein